MNDGRIEGVGRSIRAKTRAVLILAIFLLVGMAPTGIGPATAAELMQVVPAPAMDEPAAEATSETAILAGGCFWGIQAVLQHVEGVTSAVSGYAGGAAETAHYHLIGTGSTGHAEAVEVIFDPRRISFGRLLQIFFSVAHDPTELNRQGPDTGTQYRSTIFPTNPRQAEIAKAYIAQLDQAKLFDSKIETTIEPERTFYRAEDEHQDFLMRHPFHPYIIINDLPKVEGLKQLFPEIYRAKPVLVMAKPPAN